MVTGSADKSIKLWKAGRCRKTLHHHSQSVRGECSFHNLASSEKSEFVLWPKKFFSLFFYKISFRHLINMLAHIAEFVE